MKNIATIDKSNNQVTSVKSVKDNYGLADNDLEFEIEMAEMDDGILSYEYDPATGQFSNPII